MNNEYRAVEMAARESYGKLLAFLSARTQDIALAENALAGALEKALTYWVENGIPKSPEAWLMTVAKNRITDRQRQLAKFPEESEIQEECEMDQHENTLPDKRLELMMVCAHPAISSELHTPLMLQTVLGIEAKVIARLFMYSPAALTKKLVRAKAKIRHSGIPFAIPDPSHLEERQNAIFEAIYALHTYDWLDPNDNFGEEALYLAYMLTGLMPENPEAKGLAALIALSQSRCKARIVNNVLVPVDQQDMALWDDTLSQYAHRKLKDAYHLNEVGRFQIEAAIQSIHQARKQTNKTDWKALSQLYPALLKYAPSAGAIVANIVVLAHVLGFKEALEQLDKVEVHIGSGFQPLWAARAEFHAQTGNKEKALVSYEKAMSLATDTPTIRFLESKRNALT
ncbi:hypothetical protein Q8W40_23065 [Vibrio penaeicida]|uniref:RNA polymerase sigma factor n=1 Tax=Vibrio penaeicida TaxID=104609 RepID=UPI002734DFF2|nr:DUF6596 domain-containing protein [Vibrio penaeicida]MDP2575094.1 hypothetical protein [Vibrio penaeicida]